MTNQWPNDELMAFLFGLRHSFVIRHSSFGFWAEPFRFANAGGLSYIKTDETQSHHLPRRHFLLVFLGAAGLGGIEKALRRSGRFRMEDRAHGRIGVPEVGRAGGMV